MAYVFGSVITYVFFCQLRVLIVSSVWFVIHFLFFSWISFFFISFFFLLFCSNFTASVSILILIISVILIYLYFDGCDSYISMWNAFDFVIYALFTVKELLTRFKSLLAIFHSLLLHSTTHTIIVPPSLLSSLSTVADTKKMLS